MDLHDLVPFAQFKKSEKKTHGGALSSVKLQDEASNFTVGSNCNASF